MGAPLEHLALFEDEDLVSVVDTAEAVGDEMVVRSLAKGRR